MVRWVQDDVKNWRAPVYFAVAMLYGPVLKMGMCTSFLITKLCEFACLHKCMHAGACEFVGVCACVRQRLCSYALCITIVGLWLLLTNIKSLAFLYGQAHML